MDKSRTYKKVWGVAYTDVLPGENPTKEVTARMDDRHALYNDLAVRLSQADIHRFKSLQGKPICREHDSETVLGYIHGYEVGSDNHLRVMARIYTDTPEGVQACQDLEQGRLNGFSVGYTTELDPGTSTVTSKTFNELTLTEEPFFDKCYVSVQASRKSKKNLPSNKSTYNTNVLWIQLSKEKTTTPPEKIMSTPAETTPAPQTESAPAAAAPPAAQSTPPTTANPDKRALEKDASSLLKMADELQEQVDQHAGAVQAKDTENEKLRQALAAKDKELAEAHAFMEQRRAEYAAERLPEAEEVIAIQEEQRGAAFPPEARRELIATMCSMNAEDKKVAEEMSARAMNFKNQKEARLKAEEENKQLKAQIEASAEKAKLDAAKIKLEASRGSIDQIYNTSSATFSPSDGKAEEGASEGMDSLSVNASQGMGSDQNWPYRGYTGDYVMVPKPSHAETQLGLLRRVAHSENSLHVKASKGEDGSTQMSVRTAPRHRHLDAVPYSMRNRTPWWFGTLVHLGSEMTQNIDIQLSQNTIERKTPEMGLKTDPSK